MALARKLIYKQKSASEENVLNTTYLQLDGRSAAPSANVVAKAVVLPLPSVVLRVSFDND